VSRPDPTPLEARLLRLSDLLDAAARELKEAMDNVRSGHLPAAALGDETEPTEPGGHTDGDT
jgi:hypothetical protein